MIGEYVSEMRSFPVYTAVIGGEEIALTPGKRRRLFRRNAGRFSLRTRSAHSVLLRKLRRSRQHPRGRCDRSLPRAACRRCVVFLSSAVTLCRSRRRYGGSRRKRFKKALRTFCQNRRMGPRRAFTARPRRWSNTAKARAAAQSRWNALRSPRCAASAVCVSVSFCTAVTYCATPTITTTVIGTETEARVSCCSISASRRLSEYNARWHPIDQKINPEYRIRAVHLKNK